MATESSRRIGSPARRIVRRHAHGRRLPRLDELVQTDDDARRFYNNYMFLHAELYSQHAAVEASDAERMSGASRAESRCWPIVPDSACRSRLRSAWRCWLAIAAALSGVAAVSSWRHVHGDRPSLPAAEQQFVAFRRVTESRAAWPRSRRRGIACGNWPTQGVGFGSALHAGQRLELAAGLVEITFNDGAAVVLEGPASSTSAPEGEAQLHEGRLAAVVPERRTALRWPRRGSTWSTWAPSSA